MIQRDSGLCGNRTAELPDRDGWSARLRMTTLVIDWGTISSFRAEDRTNRLELAGTIGDANNKGLGALAHRLVDVMVCLSYKWAEGLWEA